MQKRDLPELSYEIDKLKSYWKDIIVHLKSPDGKIDLAYIWTDEVRKDFEGLKTEAGKLAFFLKIVHFRYKTNEQKYYKEISHIKILLSNLNKIKADAQWLKEIKMDLQQIILDIEKFKSQIKSDVISYEITPRSTLVLRKGSISEHTGDAIFFLNLSPTIFPEPGPVVGAIYDKDAEIVKPSGSPTIFEIMQRSLPLLKNSKITKKRDSFSGLEYLAEEFKRPEPYTVYTINVERAGWPNLKYLIFGNIGNASDGVLVYVWQPLEGQQSKLYEELDMLIKGALKQSSAFGVQDLAMPILTGDRASSKFFYEQLTKTLNTIKNSKLPKQITIFAYSDEDYHNGYVILSTNLKIKSITHR